MIFHEKRLEFEIVVCCNLCLHASTMTLTKFQFDLIMVLETTFGEFQKGCHSSSRYLNGAILENQNVHVAPIAE